MSFPNSDPNFDQVLQSFGFDIHATDYPEVRAKLFYCVCIVVRFILYALVFKYRNNQLVPIIVGIASFVGILNISKH